MNIRKSMDIDFDRIMEIYKNAQLFMIESGIQISGGLSILHRN